MAWEAIDYVSECLSEAAKVGSTASVSETVYWLYPILPFGIVVCTFFPTAFLEIAVYTCKYELTGCIAGLNVVFPGLDLNIKSYDSNMQMKCGIQECKRGQCLDGIMAVL